MSALSSGFPRLYAAASLKLERHLRRLNPASTAFSAALCRGLIEARPGARGPPGQPRRFSAALCRGLIEASYAGRPPDGRPWVFRGFMPRPH